MVIGVKMTNTIFYGHLMGNKLDRISNEIIRGTAEVGEIPEKVQESRLKWYGHVLRREEEYVGTRVMVMGKIRGGSTRPGGVS